jgi:PPP family 3-phenylpropionic acid transporter
METKKISARRINADFAGIQGIYWACIVPFFNYTTVYLLYHNLSNTQVGITVSGASIVSIILQFLVSDYSDKNINVPLKRTISIFFAICIVTSFVLMVIPFSIIFIMIIFLIGSACAISINSFISALFVQYKNTGLSVNYGIPRGAGSLSCAVASYILGYAVQKNTPDLILPVAVVLCGLGIIIILAMPRPEKINKNFLKHAENGEKACSTWVMLKSNPTFVLLSVAAVFIFIGQTYISFLINIIRNVGGNTTDLGLYFLINASLELPAMIASAWLLKRFKNRDLVIVSFFGFFFRLFVVAIAPSFTWIMISCIFSLFANAFFWFATVYFIDEAVQPDQRTRGQAFFGICSFGGIGTVLGSVINGYILDIYGISAMLIFCIASTLIGLLCIFITRYSYQKHFECEKTRNKVYPSINSLNKPTF